MKVVRTATLFHPLLMGIKGDPLPVISFYGHKKPSYSYGYFEAERDTLFHSLFMNIESLTRFFLGIKTSAYEVG